MGEENASPFFGLFAPLTVAFGDGGEGRMSFGDLEKEFEELLLAA